MDTIPDKTFVHEYITFDVHPVAADRSVPSLCFYNESVCKCLNALPGSLDTLWWTPLKTIGEVNYKKGGQNKNHCRKQDEGHDNTRLK